MRRKLLAGALALGLLGVVPPVARANSSASTSPTRSSSTTQGCRSSCSAWRIVHSPFGRVLVGVRDNPARARALGYSVDRYRLLAFVLSAALSGLAGGLFSISHGFASLQEVYWTTSGQAVMMVVLGGIGRT